MKTEIPAWAVKTAAPEDQGLAREAWRLGRLQVEWPDLGTLRSWARQRGWPTPWFGFKEAFLTQMLENQESFEQALRESGIGIRIPRQDYTIPAEKVGGLDALYDERSASGRPMGWGTLVEELREIRRAVEAGVVVKVEGGPELRTWQGFYEWAHGRYHMLEDGYDHWIGDDRS